MSKKSKLIALFVTISTVCGIIIIGLVIGVAVSSTCKCSHTIKQKNHAYSYMLLVNYSEK